MTPPLCALPGANTEFAGMSRRNWASTLDTLLWVPVFVLVHLSVMAGHPAGVLQLPEPKTAQFYVYFGLQFFIPMALTVFCWCQFGATPGKRALGLRVASTRTGRNLTLGMAIIRYLGYVCSAVPFGLGFMWAANEPHKQTWHDKMADSFVLYEPGASNRAASRLERIPARHN